MAYASSLDYSAPKKERPGFEPGPPRQRNGLCSRLEMICFRVLGTRWRGRAFKVAFLPQVLVLPCLPHGTVLPALRLD
jgi:hypothetical protein